MALAQQTVNVATNWTTFGVFVIALVGTLGGFTGWILQRLDRNRRAWQEFVTKSVDEAKGEFRADLTQLRDVVSELSREQRAQGQAIARIDGRLAGSVTTQQAAP